MNIRSINWNEALPIRHEILWPSKALSFCKVEGDETAMHYGVFVEEKLVSVASVYRDGRVARLRKFATLVEFQGQGIGSRLITHIILELEKLHAETFWCDARLSAAGFYEKFGMERLGSEFLKSGVSYVKMELSLQ